jgi:hypothetical protein
MKESLESHETLCSVFFAGGDFDELFVLSLSLDICLALLVEETLKKFLMDAIGVLMCLSKVVHYLLKVVNM